MFCVCWVVWESPIQLLHSLYHYRTLKYISTINLTYLTWLFHPSPSAARLPVVEPALASIMTHDHAKDLCASELGPLRISALYWLIDWLIDWLKYWPEIIIVHLTRVCLNFCKTFLSPPYHYRIHFILNTTSVNFSFNSANCASNVSSPQII